jgi:hypothetical protein
MRTHSERPKTVPSCWTALWLWALLFVTGAQAAAQPETPDPPQPSPGSPSVHTLSGVVVNSVTSEPVRRALVEVVAGPLTGGSQLSVLTDSEGRFEFPALPASEVVVMVHKPGYFNDLELHPEQFQPKIVPLGADTRSLVLKLLPESMIFGHVATLKGEPIEDSPVRILQVQIADGRKHWEVRGQATTDEDGQFRVANLVPGQYLLVTGPSLPSARFSFARLRSAREEGFGTMFYPGVPELDAATPIAISAGQQVQADFALKAEPIFRVSGFVTGLAAGTGAGLQFMSTAGEVTPVPVNLNVETGKFEAKVPGGVYVLQLRASDSSGNVAAAALPLVVSSDVEGVSIALGSSITLPVNVELRPTAAPAEPASANSLVRGEPLWSVRLISTETRIVAQEFQSDRNDKAAGLAVHNLAPGRYSVEIFPGPQWYVRSASSGTTDLLREDLVISPGRRPDPLEVVLRDDSAGVRGMIRVDGQPGAGTALLFPEQMSPAHAQVAVTAAGAEFMFTGLAPGDYRVLAFDSIDGLEFRNPEVMSSYLSKAAQVTLQPNELANVNVERVSVGK